MKTISDKNLLKHYLHNQQLDRFFPTFVHDQLQLVVYEKGEAICIQDQELHALFYLVKGTIKIVRRLFNGKEHVLESHSRPSIIGDIELMTDQNAVTSVIVLKEAHVIQLPLTQRTQLLQDAAFLYQIGKGLAQNFYKQNLISTTNMGYPVKERLASYILAIAEDGHFTLNTSLLADSFGTSYRHLHRVINQLVGDHIIERLAFKQYTITNHSALVKLAVQE